MSELLLNSSFELNKTGGPIPPTPGSYTSFTAPPGQEIVKGWFTADPTLNNAVEIEGNPYGGGGGYHPLSTVDGQHMIDMAATAPNAAGGTRMDISQHFNSSSAQFVNVDILFAQQVVGSLSTPVGDHLIAKLNGSIIFDATVQTADPAAWNTMLNFHTTALVNAGQNTLELYETDSAGSIIGHGTQPLVGFAVDAIHLTTGVGPG